MKKIQKIIEWTAIVVAFAITVAVFSAIAEVWIDFFHNQ